MLRSVKNFFKDAANEVKHDAAAAKRALAADAAYNELLEQLKSPKCSTLAQKKSHALIKSRMATKKFTNKKAVEFFNELQTNPQLSYIREEQGFLHKLFGRYGHTDTYKAIVGALKDQVNANYKRHSKDVYRGRGDDFYEEHKITELMRCQRGRLPNLFAGLDFKVGKTGEYNQHYDERRVQAKKQVK
jgi:hypothetical protein